MGVKGFDAVVRGLKDGKRYTRPSLKRGEFIFLYAESTLTVTSTLAKVLQSPMGTLRRVSKTILKQTAQGELVPWTPSQEDILSTEWDEV